MKQFMKYIRNEQGGSAVKVIAIIVIVLLLVGGAAGVYFQYFSNATFTEEQIAEATEVAQNEYARLSAIAVDYKVDQQQEAITSIGYEENKKDKQTTIYEKRNNNDTDFYILLSVQPHDSFPNLSRTLVQVFDKENRELMYEMDNVVTWKK